MKFMNIARTFGGTFLTGGTTTETTMDFTWITDIVTAFGKNVQAGGVTAIKAILPVIFMLIAIGVVATIAINWGKKTGKVSH